MKVAISLLVILLLSHPNITLSGEKVKTFIDYDFNEPVKEGLVITQATGLRGARTKLSSDLLEELPGEPGNCALRLTRHNALEFVHIQSKGAIPENCDYEVSLRCNLKEKGNFVIGFCGADGEKIAALYFQDNKLRGYDAKKKWKFTGIRIPKNEWFTLKINFHPGTRNYKIRFNDQNGKCITSIFMPLLSNKTLKMVSFSTCHPIGSSALVDDLKVAYNSEKTVKNRVDALEGAGIFTSDKDNQTSSLPLLNDGDIKTVAISRNIPFVLNIDLAKPMKVSTIRLYGGDPRSCKFPSGPCRPANYTIEGLNTAGQWRKLASRKLFQSKTNEDTPESMYQQEDFSPLDVSKLKITIEDSSDTLKRVSGKTAKDKVAVLREICILGDKLMVDDSANKFQKMVYGEFRLPVYQQQDRAELYLYNTREDRKKHKVQIELRERYLNKLVQKARLIELKYGENIIEFDLNGLPDGQYVAAVTDKNAPVKTGSSFRRLLRLQRLQGNKNDRPVLNRMTGKKMFFPDAYYLDNYTNITFHGAQAKLEQAVKPDSVSEGFIRHGYQVFFDESGKMYLPFYTVDRFWNTKSKKNFIAISSKRGQWEIAKMEKSYISRKAKQQSPIDSPPPETAKHDWAIKYKNVKSPVLRFYNPQRDGKVNLNQVYVEATRRTRGKSLNWGNVNPPPSSAWPVWHKAPGEALVLTRTPLLQDKISYGEFETITDSNDNYVGQWMSDDGKNLFYARGRLLKRYPPFTAPYDNLPKVSRIISIISTTDGVNWKYSYMVPPDKNDPPVAQHYGAQVCRVPDGNGLMMAFVYRYWAKSQRISIELAYSWNGAEWHRYSGQPAFAENGKPGTWNAGMLMTSLSAVAREGKVYQMLSWVCEGFHFYGDFYYNRSNMKEITGEKLRKYFEGRYLESWPFYKYFGSYDGIAADIRKAGVSVGIASYRQGGLFYMAAAGNKTGGFVSRLITASNGMAANISIGKGGFFIIELTDGAGKLINGYSKKISQGDNINMPIFDKLPKTPFKIKVRLENTRLFSFNF